MNEIIKIGFDLNLFSIHRFLLLFFYLETFFSYGYFSKWEDKGIFFCYSMKHFSIAWLHSFKQIKVLCFFKHKNISTVDRERCKIMQLLYNYNLYLHHHLHATAPLQRLYNCLTVYYWNLYYNTKIRVKGRRSSCRFLRIFTFTD